jgi:hypothetical protein
LNVGSYLAFLLWALLLVVAFGWLGGGAGLGQVLANRRFWLFVLSALAIAPFILGEADARWGMLRLSQTGLETGLWMALRAATLMVATYPYSRSS